jgi:hypothetical protein
MNKIHYCNICNKNYKSYKSLWNHNKKFHIIQINESNNDIKKYNCNYCYREFINYQNRWKHEKVCKEKGKKTKEQELEITKLKKEQELEITKLKKELEMKNNIIQNSLQPIQPKQIQNGGHIYLIQEREFMNANQNVYKIGRTKDINQRVKGYPKDSRLCYTRWTPNIEQYEKEIIDLFKMNFINKKEIGSEYFEGDENIMINQIHQYYNIKIEEIISK